MATLTINPVPGSTAAGVVENDRVGSPTTWNALVTGSGTVAAYSTDNQAVAAFQKSSNYIRIWRGVFQFDTSSLGAGATISAAVMSIYGVSKQNTASSSPTFNVYGIVPAAAATLAASDYQTAQSTAFCASSISYSGWTLNAYNDFAFNATGIAAINKTGVSAFCVRSDYDVTNTDPLIATNTLTGMNGTYGIAGTNKPKLVITYTSVIPNLLPFFMSA